MKRIIFLFLALTAIISCTEYKEVSVSNLDIQSLKLKNATTADIQVSALVNNPTKHTLSLILADATLIKEGKEFAYFTLTDTVSVAPSTNGAVTITVEGRIVDPIAFLTTGLDFRSWSPDQFTVDGKCIVKSSQGYKKRIKLKDVPAKKLIGFFR